MCNVNDWSCDNYAIPGARPRVGPLAYRLLKPGTGNKKWEMGNAEMGNGEQKRGRQWERRDSQAVAETEDW